MGQDRKKEKNMIQHYIFRNTILLRKCVGTSYPKSVNNIFFHKLIFVNVIHSYMSFTQVLITVCICRNTIAKRMFYYSPPFSDNRFLKIICTKLPEIYGFR